MRYSRVEIKIDSPETALDEYSLKAYEYAYDQGWTDGLPIVPATRERIAQFVATSGRAGDDVIGVLPPRNGSLTVELVAANAVMAGCRPELMPVVVAALEGMFDPSFPLADLQGVNNNAPAPFLLVNGPIRKKLFIQFGSGCLGPGWRPNSTIGRAVRFALCNGGGNLSGVYTKSCFGSPLQYSFMCAEAEEGNPWSTFHVDRGFVREQNTVTSFYASSYCSIDCNVPGYDKLSANSILRHIATHMPPTHGSNAVLLLLGVSHARMLHRAGLSKRDVQQQLWELARLPHSYFAENFVASERAAGRGDAQALWRCATPDDFHIAVAGGPGLTAGGPGPQDVYIAVRSPQTRLIAGNYPMPEMPEPWTEEI